MRTECVNNTAFNGKLFIADNLSKKPRLNLGKVKLNIQKYLENKNYNLYFKQDYTTNKVNIDLKEVCSNPFSLNFSRYETEKETGFSAHVDINAKASKYFDAVKDAIYRYEEDLKTNAEKEWELEQTKKIKEDFKEFAGSLLFFPLFAVNDILHSINPKWSNKFEKIIDNLI